MAVKTKEGWATRKQIARQERAWRAARQKLMEKMGTAINDADALDAKSLEIFKEMDKDGNGKIDMDELKAAFELAGVKLKSGEVKEMVAEADADGDGHIDPDEFKALVRKEVDRYKVRTQVCSIQ
uniref:EF-hand domain-containing protein n=1 Tax=Prymnesium polylepis TaxID=72548 RepID=A0A6V4B6Q6_9EUKA|mmetsp:Transcript_20621/g.55469  ORF Transcript_20621/g.55469 Transcript_20621/m.55469 type:complete len:125 (-) Transcript_20621:59-433(-)